MRLDIELRDPRLHDIVDTTAALLEPVSTGHLFTEGPLWDARRCCLFFTDIPGDRILRWSAEAGTTVWREPSRKANGLAWDRQGRLLACEHASSRLTRTEFDGTLTVMASHHEGRELNSPNDVVCATDGAVYFSDPGYGRLKYYGVERECQLGFRGVYRVDAQTGRLSLLADDFGQPNGLCFSAGEERLYVNDTERGHIREFALRADGSLGGGSVWASLHGEGSGAPDGMKFDSRGHLYCCGPGGVHVFDSAATCLGVLRVPAVAANFTWGDADLKSLYITASDTLWRLRVKLAGHAG